jgi:glycosyltransferase involved in cell wall biosynthesis
MDKFSLLVSVIMPVKDNEKYLSIAIESILTQTYENIELIIIDDSKNKLCSDIIKSYNTNKIKYIKGPKINLATALNIGIDNSNGDFIARMDSDDIAHQDRILQQVNALKQNKWDICGTWIKQFGNDSRVYTYPSKPEEIKYWMMFTCAIAHPTVLAKSEIFRKFKYNYDSKVEDHELWTRMLRSKVVFGNIPKVLLKYRRHEDASTSYISENLISEREKIIKNYAFFLQPNKLIEPFLESSCGTSNEYRLDQIIKLCDFIFSFVQKGLVSKDLLIKMMPVYFRKCNKMNKNVFVHYSKLLNKYNLSFFTFENFYILTLSIFNINRNNKLYALKRFI